MDHWDINLVKRVIHNIDRVCALGGAATGLRKLGL